MSASNILENVVPASARQAIYVVYAVVGVVLGALAVAFGTLSGEGPEWLAVANAVYLYVGGAVGLVAASNTTARPVEREPGV